MKRVFLLFTFVFSFIGINAGIVETIKELYNYPFSLYGIVIDTPTDRDCLQLLHRQALFLF